MYQQPEPNMLRQQNQAGAQAQFFPGFPGIPGFPGTDLNQRVRRLETEVDRLQRLVGQLERRVRRLESGGGYNPWGEY